MNNVINKGQIDSVIKGHFKIVGLLKACAEQKDLKKGSELHAYVFEHKLLEENCYVACTLVSMYAKCGALAKAQQVLDELAVRDVVTWNALLAGYGQQRQCNEVLICLDIMQCEGHSPNAVTFIWALKACGSIGAVSHGKEIHNKIVSSGLLEKTIELANTLVDMYAKCGAFAKAQHVVDELPVRNVITWNALIGGYAQQGHVEMALKCLESMQYEGHTPNAVTFICILKTCGTAKTAALGERIHNKVVTLGLLKKDIMLGNTLVDMYARCGALGKAQEVLQELPVRDVVTWNALIGGFIEQGQGEEALKCFESMEHSHEPLDSITFICALKACGCIGAITKGKHIHGKILNLGLLEKNIVLGNALMDMYVKCGAVKRAQEVHDELLARDVITWTVLIFGYFEESQGEEALKCFDTMQCEGHSPTGVTFICALRACGMIGAADRGAKIQHWIANLGILEKDIVLGNTVVDMYVKCGELAKAAQVLDELPIQDVVVWTALIAGYAQKGQGQEALKCFDNMQRKGHAPNEVTFVCALKACASIGAAVQGEKIHGKIVNSGLLEKNVALGNTLVDMYARCGSLAKAQKVLDELPVRDVSSWNALITGYVQQGHAEEALKCFDDMQCDGQSPDAVTFTCALKACGKIGAVTKGEEIHKKAVNLGLLDKDIELASTLVDMYAKCGALAKAVELLDEIPDFDVVTWTAVIAGYAQQGQSGEALNCFERMKSKRVRPDSATLVCVLNACAHSGLLDQGVTYFVIMNTKYDIVPDVEHYCCMVDLFSRAGEFNRALVMIQQMQSADCLAVWLALLGSCRNWGELTVGRLAFEHALHLQKRNGAAYICMANTYRAIGMQDDAEQIETMQVINKAL